jgi:hypothetical protein
MSNGCELTEDNKTYIEVLIFYGKALIFYGEENNGKTILDRYIQIHLNNNKSKCINYFPFIKI